jgi:iron complex transport system permease protein
VVGGAAGRDLHPARRRPGPRGDREVIATSRSRAAGGEAVRLPSPVRAALPLLAGSCFLAASLVTGLLMGPVHIGVTAVGGAAASHLPFLGIHSHLSAPDSAVLWQLRAPRVVLGALVGGMLALAGASYQGAFRNPLADPYLLGIAAGAGLGATIAIAYLHGAVAGFDLIPLAAFVGAAGGVACAYVLGTSAGGGRSPAALILAGVTTACFLTAVQTFIQQQHSQSLQEIYSWILGKLDTSGWHDVGLVTPYVAVSAVVILLHRRVLDVLSVGDEEAASLGVNVRRTRLLVVVFATVGTAAAVAVSGLIGFVGIIVPHAIRLALGPSYRLILPLSVLVGAGFLVLADVLARTVMSPAELPIGVVTAFFGAPFFAVILRTSRSFT